MNSNIQDNILNRTFTQTQAKQRIRILKSYILKILFGGQASMDLSPHDLEWLKSLPEEFYQHFNKDNVYQIFSDLEVKINKLEVLTIYLAFEPDEKTTAAIGVFAKKTFNPSLLLDIKFDPNLIAGVALVRNGIFKDYSLKAKLTEKREEISQSFKRFLR